MHVTDRIGRPSLIDLLARGGEIPNSAEENGYCGSNARFVEDQVGHSHCVYFYAGRACPTYGSVALAFAPTIEDRRFQTATPFDSGGLIKQPAALHRAFQINLDPDDLTQRVAYYQNSVVRPPSQWREEFARWLTFYFPDPRDYWEGIQPPIPKIFTLSIGRVKIVGRLGPGKWRLMLGQMC